MYLHKSLDGANHFPGPLLVLPGMRDFASRSARLRDYVLLRDLLAFCGPLDHGLYMKLREVTLKTSGLSRSRCLVHYC
jgi:hypothetical protein